MIKFNNDKTPLNKNLMDDNKEKLQQIHNDIWSKNLPGSEFMDWLKWAENHDTNEVEEMIKTAKFLREDKGVNKLLVIGIGGSYLGAKAAIDFVNGSMYDEVRFAGINLSADYFKDIEKWLEGSNWAITIISKSGTTLEPSISFRYFKELLKNQYDDFNERIVAITDKAQGTLKEMSNENGWTTFVVPDGIGGRFSGISPVGLFPMAFANIDIKELLSGVLESQKEYEQSWDNDAMKYALTRYELGKTDIVEMFASYDPDLVFMSEWIKQLFGESEGKEGKGLLPASVTYTADLHSLGQWLQEGNVKNNIFETTIWVENSKNDITIPTDDVDKENLNSLSGVTLDEINKQVMYAVIDAHNEGGVPQNVITLNDKSAKELGKLWYFFFITVTATATLLGVNAFNQPGVETYKANMKQNLDKIKK